MTAVVSAVARHASERKDILANAYECYSGSLKAYLRRSVDESEAEDLVQDVYLRIARHPGLGMVENLQAFLYTTATNLLRDRWRRANAKYAPALVNIEDCVLAVGASDPAEIVEWRETVERLAEAFETLPEKPKKALHLHRFWGCSYAEIAEQLEVSVSMIEKHISASLSHLRKAVC